MNKPWDLCAVFQCRRPTLSGKKEKDRTKRYCGWHTPARVAHYTELHDRNARRKVGEKLEPMLKKNDGFDVSAGEVEIGDVLRLEERMRIVEERGVVCFLKQNKESVALGLVRYEHPNVFLDYVSFRSDMTLEKMKPDDKLKRLALAVDRCTAPGRSGQDARNMFVRDLIEGFWWERHWEEERIVKEKVVAPFTRNDMRKTVEVVLSKRNSAPTKLELKKVQEFFLKL